MSVFPLTPELRGTLKALHDIDPKLYLTSACSQDEKMGACYGCTTQQCEPGPNSLRSVILVPGEREYLEERTGKPLRFKGKGWVAVEKGERCPYNVGGRCTAGGEGGPLRPFSCKLFPIHFQKTDVRAAVFFLNTLCPAVRDQLRTKPRIKFLAQTMRNFVLALWIYLPPHWWDLWSESRSVIAYKYTNNISFDLELDTVEYSRDRGVIEIPYKLIKSLASDDCPHCTEGLDNEALKLNKRRACAVCAGPRYWDLQHFTEEDKKVRSIDGKV